MKSKIFTITIVMTTVVLGIVAAFTAYRLYELRSGSATPSSPNDSLADGNTSSPPPMCELFVFTVSAQEPTNTPTTVPQATATPTEEPEATATPTEEPEETITPTKSPTATTTQTLTTTDSDDPNLPVAGVSMPTILAAGFGAIVLFFSLAIIL